MEEWVWSNGGMILTGENWSAGRKTLYSVGGRWMNVYGAMVEWYRQGKTEVLGGKTLYSVGGIWMNEYGTMVEWHRQGKTEVLGGNALYSVGGRWMNEYGTMGKFTGRRNRSTRTDTCTSATWSTVNPIRTGSGSKPRLHQSHATALQIFTEVQ